MGRILTETLKVFQPTPALMITDLYWRALGELYTAYKSGTGLLPLYYEQRCSLCVIGDAIGKRLEKHDRPWQKCILCPWMMIAGVPCNVAWNRHVDDHPERNAPALTCFTARRAAILDDYRGFHEDAEVLARAWKTRRLQKLPNWIAFYRSAIQRGLD